MDDVSTVLATLRAETALPDLVGVLYQLEDYYERKLWNQLTLALDELYQNPETVGAFRVRVFTQFVAQFQNKLNPIRVVDFLVESFESPAICLEKLRQLQELIVSHLTKQHSLRKVDNLEELLAADELVIYVKLQIARHLLLLGKEAEAEELLDLLQRGFDGLQNDYLAKINAAFYLTRSEYHKKKADFNRFYADGLLYLSSLEKQLLTSEQQRIGYDLCMAALLGTKIYNFGELILHGVLQLLDDDEHRWLFSLVKHLNAGNRAKFGEWLAVAIEKLPLLAHNQRFLREKIVIMLLLELISLRDNRLLLAEIARVTGAAECDVETLLIKTFSLGLVRGQINELEQRLEVTWLQPRILNLDQVKVLYNHLVLWNSEVEKLAAEVHRNGGLVWATQ